MKSPTHRKTPKIMLLMLFLICSAGLLAQAVKPNGDGSQGTPFEISSAANLRWLSETSTHEAWGKPLDPDRRKVYYTQTQDIDLEHEDLSGWNDGHGWLPIGRSAVPFHGFYDGNNKSISHLRNNPSSFYINSELGGMFDRITSGEVRNLALINVD